MADDTSTRSYINIQVSSELKAAAEKAAGNTSVSSWARQVLADKLGVKLDAKAASRRQKYATPEEAKAAKEAYATTRAAAIAQLMADPENAAKIKALLEAATAKAVEEVRAKAAAAAKA